MSDFELNTPDLNGSKVSALSGGADLALQHLPAIPRDRDGPVFAAPWQAQVFAITLALYERGLFSWSEWAEHLSAAIGKAQQDGDPDCGDSYYLHWLAALEAMMLSKQIAMHDQLHSLQHAWANAADNTPHGQAIELPTSQRVALTTDYAER